MNELLQDPRTIVFILTMLAVLAGMVAGLFNPDESDE